MKRLIPLIICALIFGPLIFIHSCANTTEAPTGGPKDTIPPKVVKMMPPMGQTNVDTSGVSFIFTFNEFVTIKTATNIYLSPPQSKSPKSKVQDKNLVITLEESLKPNTTYTLNLSDAIADNNEGNMLSSFVYVFSTGSSIDSMVVTGTVLDCNKLEPVKGATVMLYRDLSDSAIIKHRPQAAAKTDDWGFFCLPYLCDTVYRLYAIKDASGNNIYDKEEDRIAFLDSLVRPTIRVRDSLPELMTYDMKDTLGCQARKSEHSLILFREKPDRQYLKNKVRTADRSAYVSFQAPEAWIDSLWIAGYDPDRIITQFNREQDSLEIWVNDRRPAPDTLHLFVSYRKTDSLNALHPELEHLKLLQLTADGKPVVKPKRPKKADIKHEDTICVFKLNVAPETVEQEGWQLEFKYPIIEEHFKDISFKYINPKQKEFQAQFDCERDSMNLRIYKITPKVKLQKGYDYILKIPQNAFRDINGFYSDSLESKITLPTEQELSLLKVNCQNVDQMYIVELLDEKASNTLRTYTVDKDTELEFPYLKPAKYCIRITSDANGNSLVDSGSLLEHRQPEKVRFYTMESGRLIDIPAGVDVTQDVDFKVVFEK